MVVVVNLGSGLSDASDPKGKYVREVFSAVDMDIVTIGNHELYKVASSANDHLFFQPHYGVTFPPLSILTPPTPS